ncbi:MAG: GNAT family N-acetyltransferase [Planctomycetota bacterium]
MTNETAGMTEGGTERCHETGRYRVRIAGGAADVRRAQELRFAVFNRELDEGLSESWERGYDEDVFDASCDHLIVEHTDDDVLVGTYRLQATRNARTPPGLYTAGEFDLSGFSGLLGEAVETGRACIHRDHRNTRVLQLLWQGIGSYMVDQRARYLFGCCSLTSQDPEEAKATWRWLAAKGHLHPGLHARPRPEHECFPEGAARQDGPVARGVPPLFASYLRIGTKVAGEPALDRQFKTIDFLAILDLADLSPANRRRFLP